jgi:hypothetical protein
VYYFVEIRLNKEGRVVLSVFEREELGSKTIKSKQIHKHMLSGICSEMHMRQYWCPHISQRLGPSIDLRRVYIALWSSHDLKQISLLIRGRSG